MTRSMCVIRLLLAAAATAAVASCDDGSRRAARIEAEARAEAERAKARAEVQAEVEAGRLAVLWTYFELPVGKGRQLTATIRSMDNVDSGGAEEKAVMLVFRDHPAWGRSSYLVLENGDFNCGRCIVNVVVDGGSPAVIPAHRPRSNEAIAIFIDDWKALWKLTAGAKLMRIEFPARPGKRTATFEVAGLDRTKMPGWD